MAQPGKSQGFVGPPLRSKVDLKQVILLQNLQNPRLTELCVVDAKDGARGTTVHVHENLVAPSFT